MPGSKEAPSHRCTFFVLRTPLLPATAFLDPDLPGDGDYGSRRARALERLRELLNQGEVSEALRVASPGVRDRVAGVALDRGDIALAVARYLTRMSLRCTPFGLFAGVSTGDVGESSVLRLGERAGYRRHSRLDMGYLCGVVDGLVEDPAVRAELRFRPNSSLYQSGARLHYFEARQTGPERSYFLVAAQEDDVLRDTLARSACGARLAELAAALVSDEIDEGDAREYVEELVRAQILVPELAPAVTGPNALADLIEQLDAIPAAAAVRDTLRLVAGELAAIDAEGVCATGDRVPALYERLRGLRPDADESRLLQVDLTKPTEQLRLGRDVVDEVRRAFEFLHDLFGASIQDGLAPFRHAFRERYGDAELPLVEVLDEEAGIGFRSAEGPAAEAAPLLHGLDLAAPATSERLPYDACSQLLLRKLVESIESGAEEIELTEDEVRPLRADRKPSANPLPDSYSVMASVWHSTDGDLAIRLDGGGGPSGVRMLARFCPMDERLDTSVREHLRHEEAARPDARYFEIVHLPEGRLGNILHRTVLRGYELAFLGRSGAPSERQLAIDDLLVSLDGDRVVLRSRRHGCELIPRLSSAHNALRRSTGVYRFLFELQRQRVVGGLRFQWGHLDSSPFLPRVRHGRVVLSPRRWNVRAAEVSGLADVPAPDRFVGLRDWARSRRLPRYFVLVDADRGLPVDLENPLSVEGLWELVRRRGAFVLEELLPSIDRCAVTGPEGGFAHELLLPFVRATAVKESRSVRTRERPASLHRPIGGNWLYAKIYCGKATADALLRDHLGPLQRRLAGDGRVASWFFIRYADPHVHVRLRARGEPSVLTRVVFPAWLEALRPLQVAGLVWRVQFDGYDPESLRYGGAAGLAQCEEIFGADSEAAIDCLSLLSGDETAQARWRMCLLGMDALLDDFGMDPIAKYALFARLGTNFRKEFQAGNHVKKQVLGRFRRERSVVESALSSNGSMPAELRASREIFALRTKRVRPLAEELCRLATRGELGQPLHEVAASLLHMHANRMLRSAARAQEMVLYSMLAQHHDSQLARRGIKGKERERRLKALG